MSTLMRFDFGAFELQFEEGGSYPATRPIEKQQIIDRTAAGELQTEELGRTLRRRTLNFVDMSKVDHDALENWFDNVANGAENAFDFTDERGFTGEVKFIDNTFDFQETDFELFSGSLTVEYI